MQHIENLNNMFEKNGFNRSTTKEMEIIATIGDETHRFPYETNKIFTVESCKISFAIAQKREEKYLFISHTASGYYEGDTSPYRTFYPGLMKEPFTLVYPLHDRVTIHVAEDVIIEISVSNSL